MSATRRVTVDEAIGIVDGGMSTRAITDDVRAAWTLLRGELRKRPRPSSAMRAVDAELARGRTEAGIEEPTR